MQSGAGGQLVAEVQSGSAMGRHTLSIQLSSGSQSRLVLHRARHNPFWQTEPAAQSSLVPHSPGSPGVLAPQEAASTKPQTAMSLKASRMFPSRRSRGSRQILRAMISGPARAADAQALLAKTARLAYTVFSRMARTRGAVFFGKYFNRVRENELRFPSRDQRRFPHSSRFSQLCGDAVILRSPASTPDGQTGRGWPQAWIPHPGPDPAFRRHVRPR